MNMFEIKISNSVNDQTQHVSGYFGTVSDSTFTSTVCPAGTLCVKSALAPSEGYESFGILNGNTWQFVAATSGAGVPVTYGDHTHVYAFNNYDVSKATLSNGEVVNLGRQTLGLSLPAGERGDFCEIKIGEQYQFGGDNFTAEPSSSDVDAIFTVSSGKLAAASSATAAATGELAFQLKRIVNVTEGSSNAGSGYVMLALRATAS